jgi:hypothetical protein
MWPRSSFGSPERSWKAEQSVNADGREDPGAQGTPPVLQKPYEYTVIKVSLSGAHSLNIVLEGGCV